MLSPELETWEDRIPLASEMIRVAERMEQEGLGITPFLPSLQKPSQTGIETVAKWTEAAMEALQVNPPEWTPERSPAEKVQELVDLLSAAAIPREPSEFR